jgi:hypothetical protein
MTDDTIESLLEHWSRWARGSRIRYGHCGSIEGLYRPERVRDDIARQPAPVREFGLQDVFACETAVVALPEQYRVLVVVAWLHNMPPFVAIRRARLRPSGPAAWPIHRSATFGLLRRNLGARLAA